MKRKALNFISSVFVFCLLANTTLITIVHAEESIYINVGEAEVKRSLIAIPTIKATSNTKDFLQAKNILQASIEKNLNFTNYFKLIPAASYLEDINSVSHLPKSIDASQGFDFQKWKDAGAEFLIQGIVRKIGKNASSELYLYYVPQNRLILQKEYSNSNDSFLEMANDFSNDVMLKLTGKTSIFKTKLVMTSDRNNSGYKEVFTSNWDGANFKQVTIHKSISLSPT
jgi:TolB protein